MGRLTSERRLDLAVLTILAIGAGCGLVYEYLLSHYAGRVLGAMEVAIFGIITVMMVFMGIGSFLARNVKNPYAGFAWLEIILALLGSTSVLLIGSLFALSELFPKILMDTFGLTADLAPSGGLIATMEGIARFSPYLIGAVLGTLIGMEIPLISEIRSDIHKGGLKNNAGSVYGIDYIGAGVGATLWLLFMLAMDVSLAGALTASANLTVGILFFLLFRKKIRWPAPLLAAHVLTAIVVIQVYDKGRDWSDTMEDLLYRDEVAYRLNTKHQRLVVTERIMDPAKPKVLTFYINGRTQFASSDEHIYHAMLTYTALAASARHKKILVVGGGDGLAVRDILRWNPEKVMLLDLDEDLVRLFREPMTEPVDNSRLLAANGGSFSDPRVEFRFGDAFLSVDELLRDEALFDAIIVDLPDPSHPDLNKLYSTRFYAKLYGLLAGDGAMVVQSTSPYHAKKTFISIGKTVQHAGFAHVDQYHANVPSFGEWGWTIATKNGKSARARLAELENLPVDDGWTTKGLLLAAFEFEKGFYDDWESIDVNRLGTMVAYRYHYNDWQREMGIYQLTKEKNQ
ncbi:MAG: polyamine aminopropyltransferase [Pseudomonadota bacterium]